ncbi:MAG: hypothetical protein CEE38_13890 [Planctomycetes bacterium B3_Pla]|nr:MAG: hypothetical protein CEE38_13890 [Planctomycetes bacterium B3_Pla]
MNKTQKIERFNLIVILIALTLSAIAVSVFYFVVDLPIRRALGGLGFLGIAGLIGLSPILFGKRRGRISFDERDQLIHIRAAVVAYSVFWLVFTAACMIPWWILETGAAIPVVVLPAMLAGGFVIVQLVQSVTTLVKYGRSHKGEES